jgi:flagellar basal body rod protein FlgG
MSSFIEIATGVLNQAERRLETVSGNVANMTTPGYKSQTNFSYELNAVDSLSGSVALPNSRQFTQHTQGTMSPSSNQLDLAISGPGMFRVMGPDAEYLTRDGRFAISKDGVLVDSRGFEVADTSGRAIQLGDGSVEILTDGTVLQDGLPQGRIGVFLSPDNREVEAIGGSLFSMVGDVEATTGSLVRQGMLEGSNVVLAEEMIEMMAAIRYAEAGSQLIQTYDNLLGRAFSTFGQG